MEDSVKKQGAMSKEEIEEELLGQCLRSGPFLKRLEKKYPIFDTRLPKSSGAQKAWCNRWHVDKYGVVIHYPEAIHLTGQDFGEFKEIPLSEEDRNFKMDKFDSWTTINLLATQFLVALEFRSDHYHGRANVYDRKSLELVYAREHFKGFFYTGGYNGNTELFVKDADDKGCARAIKINQWGKEEIVWKGVACCNCNNKKIFFPVQVYYHENMVLRFCYLCFGGNLRNAKTAVTTKEFSLRQKLRFPKAKVSWYEHCNIVAVEDRDRHADLLLSLGLINIETGQVELFFETIEGDFFRCYAVSDKYLVVCFRNWKGLRPHKNEFTHMIVKNRVTGEKTEFQVPEFEDKIDQLQLISKSILIAMPCGRTDPETGILHENVYTLNLDDKDPRTTIKSFKVPISEVRPINKDKLICKISTDKDYRFQVYSLT